MGKLTFQAALGGTVDLVGPNTAGAVTLNLPTASGDLVGTGSTGVVTTGMISGQIAVAQGGTGASTAQTAINTLIGGTITSGQYLRANGTNAVMSFIQAADVPTLNQNTTGTAAGLSSILAVASGGTGTSSPGLVAGTNVTITGTWPNQTINSSGGGSGMIYPGAGIPNSTGSAWGTSYSTTGSGNVVLGTAPSISAPKIDYIQASTSTGSTNVLGFTNNAGTANGPYLNVGNATPSSNNPIVLSVTNAGIYGPNLEFQAAGNGYVAVNNPTTTSIKLRFNPTGTASTTTTLTSAQTANRVLNLPDADDTLIGKATTDLLTNKTINAAAGGNSIYGISLTTGVTGTLPVNLGGTNQTSYTDGQLLIGNSTGNTLAKSTLTAGSGISITNGAGSITIAATNSGTVTSVTGTSPVVSSGGTTPAISLATAYGDTLNPYASKTANYVLAAPNGTAGVPTFRAIVAADIPTLNQNTTGTAANVTGTVAIGNGGTGQTTASAAFNALSPITTAGDLILGNGTNSATRLGIGANGYVLTSNGTTASWAAASSGSGTVTSITAGTGLTGGTITTSGTIALGTTAVTAGSYTSANITVDAYGRITAAANGSGGGGGGLSWQAVQTANFTATSGNAYPVNTTAGAITVTLPASPTAGNMVTIVDYAGTAATNNITVNPNGNNLQGTTDNVLIVLNRQGYNFVYVDATQGWISYAQEYSATPQPYTVSYLVVSGGGGGGRRLGGGGGAGGLLANTTTLTPLVNYSIIVGAGGAGGSSDSIIGGSGTASSFGSIASSVGGGGGGSYASVPSSGGSGGGGTSGEVGSNAGASGTSGQGYAGGSGLNASGAFAGGGGGGSGSVGQSVSNAQFGGNGGTGTASSITGTSTYYASGGGGGQYNGTAAGTASAGGGGNGGFNAGTPGTGTANTGGGGGGGAYSGGGINGSAGGSGVVILSIPTAKYSGVTTGSPTVTTSGSNTILKFTVSGSYTA